MRALMGSNIEPFTSRVEVYELKTYVVHAKNKQDVERAMKVLLSTQEEIKSIIPKRGLKYEVVVEEFVMRDGPEEDWK